MDDPKTYEKVNYVVRKDITEIFEQNPIKWQENNARVLDIGCGDGSVTMKILIKYMPKNFMKLVGCDLNKRNVHYAQQYYGSDKVQFITLDIKENIPDELKGGFDHIFSSYTFHWVPQQEAAFANVYDMLAEGGNCLIVFLGRSNLYELYDNMSRNPKWKEDLKDARAKFISPYFDSQDPASEVSSIMERIGFKDVKVKATRKTYSYRRGLEEWKMLMKSLNPFESLKEKWEDFMDDCVKVDPDVGTVKYVLIEAYGSK